MKYKNIFITGSTGVVGKPLLKKLIENGHNVYALSRSEENKKILESKGVSVISGNILTSDLFNQFKNILPILLLSEKSRNFQSLFVYCR